MSWIGRVANLFRQRRLQDSIDEEMESHLEEAMAHGRSVMEARRAFGNRLLQRERSRDFRLFPWLDALASDFVFGCRQLRKRPAVSAAAILSLALAIGATTGAFRLIHAVLFRELPVAAPEQLFYLAATDVDRDGHLDYRDDFDYPTFQQYSQAVADRADLMVVGGNPQQDAIFGSGSEAEKVYRQYLSGNVFHVFGLKPALGRLIAPYDDISPGREPVAVLGYDYWTRRFGRDPKVLEKTFRMAGYNFQVIGVAPKGFIGTEPGAVTDVFIPAMMNAEAIHSPGWSWFQLWVRPHLGFSPDQVRQPLQAVYTRSLREEIKRFHSNTPKSAIDAYLSGQLVLFPAASGVSDLQKSYRRPLFILSGLVVLVLLIACINVGNLLNTLAISRAREMALRVSIGAGRWRLIQLILVESSLLALIAMALGSLFAFWLAPLVISMLRVPEDPVRLVLDSGWQGFLFSALLASFVALFCGLAPALKSSGVKPIHALKGGESISRTRGMHALLAAQVAFCVLVQFVAWLFVSTFYRLSNRPLGFSYDHVLVVDSSASKKPGIWIDAVEQVRRLPGVQSAALSGWPLLSRNRWTKDVQAPGHELEAEKPLALAVSPGFFETMDIGLLAGREFRPTDRPPRLDGSRKPLPGVAVVNEAFAKTYFDGKNPVGRTVQTSVGKDTYSAVDIVGYVRNAVYYDVREKMHPTMYLPMEERETNTLLIRTAGDPMLLARAVREAIPKANSGFQILHAQTQAAFVRWQMLRERLLAALSMFFAILALLLSAIGLYGLLNSLVTRRRHEIGIRMALGAPAAHIVRSVTLGLLVLVTAGLVIGTVGGLACSRLLTNLLFDVKPNSIEMILAPLLALAGAAIVAMLPPVMRAVQIDPAQTLRNE